MTGRLQGVVFENQKDLFKILDIEVLSALPGYEAKQIRVTGNFGQIEVGELYRFKGDLVVHDRFGTQFRAQSYQLVMPNQTTSLTKYLISDKFPGIGKKAAEHIITQFGVDALTLLRKNPSKIDTLDLTSKQKSSLLSGLSKIDSYSQIILKLTQYGVPSKLANKLYQVYHDDSLSQLEKDPYTPIVQVEGYSFRLADRLGKAFQIPEEADSRLEGAIYQVLKDALNQSGNTYVPLKNLVLEVSEAISLKNYDLIVHAVNQLQQKEKIVVQDDKAFLAYIYTNEKEIADYLKQFIERKTEIPKYSQSQLNHAIQHAESALHIKYDATQKLAIANALTHTVSILTGGPGTGKTTIISGILLCLRELETIPAASLYSQDPPFLLAAPTGRAAKRMSEITGITAKTIHRMLGLGIGDRQETELNELNGEILIIDEMSMIDMFLFKQLLSAIQTTKRLVFVGDQDQLPSVGPGNIFGDLIASDAIATTKLEQIHRQADESSIITLAHHVNLGDQEQLLFQKTKNYSFIPCQADLVDKAISQIIELAMKKFSPDDIQVLGAMYHGSGGITHLNDVLQKIMNPKGNGAKTIESHQELFRIGDRILQLQNNPEKEIYNGQIGKVIGIDEKDTQHCLTANFDDREISFSRQDLFDLTRAYAITIHKAQGSEFPVVILNLTMQNYVMLRRNLLYTAITRAEKNLVLVGERRAYEMALKTPGNDRRTGLIMQIRAAGLGVKETPDKLDEKRYRKDDSDQENPSDEKVLTPEKIYSGQIDPMIGMSGVELKKISV